MRPAVLQAGSVGAYVPDSGSDGERVKAMLLIGLLIVVAVAVFGGVVLSENWGGDTYTITGFGHTLGHLTLGQIFLSGVALTALFFLGVWAASVSSRLRRRASGRRRAETRAIREERESLAAERDKLAAELEAERAGHGTPAADLPPAYPREAEVYADRSADATTTYPAYAEPAASDEARRHTV
jgi:uncharacterized membrane protein